MLKKNLKIILIATCVPLLMFAWGAWRWMEGNDEGRQRAIAEFSKLRNIEGLSLNKAIDRLRGKSQSEFMFHCENFCKAGCISMEIEEAKKETKTESK